MKLFLGVDGGQSSTVALIGDETGRVLGQGRGGPCNHVQAGGGREKFLRALEESIGEACAQAGLPTSVEFEAACLGFSGGPSDKEALIRESLRSRLLTVTTDALIALSGATAGKPGVVVIAGTGSIAWGRNAEQRVARAGGWGYIYGDEGGAFDIVRQAVRAALRFEEGWGPSTQLYRRLVTETGAADANDMLHKLYTDAFPRARVAQWAKLVDEIAAEGDAVARNILLNAAQQLAALAAAVREQLFPAGWPVLISYIGGVFRSALVLERFRMLVELHDHTHLFPPQFGPAAGALLEAYRQAGLEPQLTKLNLTEAEK